jgi:hypothetical protein
MITTLAFLKIVWDRVDYPAWIAAIAALIGVPLSMVSLIKLVRRDKEKEQQIAAIVNITSQLGEQVKELSAQTSEFKYQSDMMFEHNKLLEKQFELQKSIQEEHRGFEAETLALKKQERLSDIRPYFTFKGGGGNQSSHDIVLVNKGAVAVDITTHEGDMESVIIRLPRPEIEKGGQLSLNVIETYVRLTGNRNNRFYINYKDIDGNLYQQFISLNGHTYDVAKPMLSEST